MVENSGTKLEDPQPGGHLSPSLPSEGSSLNQRNQRMPVSEDKRIIPGLDGLHTVRSIAPIICLSNTRLSPPIISTTVATSAINSMPHLRSVSPPGGKNPISPTGVASIAQTVLVNTNRTFTTPSVQRTISPANANANMRTNSPPTLISRRVHSPIEIFPNAKISPLLHGHGVSRTPQGLVSPGGSTGQSPITPPGVIQKRISDMTIDSDNKSSPDSSSPNSSPESTETISGPISHTGTPLAPPSGQPVKRRPGRPPGSTRKYKNPYSTTEYRRKSDSSDTDDFSLRKFFEAGGRDYNEYLEWLKKRGQQTNGMMSTVMSAPFPAMPAQVPMSNIPTVTMPAMTFSQRSSMFPPQQPRPAVVSPVLPPGYRPILIPTPSMQSGMRQEMLPVPMPGFPLIHPGMGGIPGSMQQQQQQSPNLPPKPESETPALDLTSKKRKSDSSEDEAVLEHRKFLREEAVSPVGARSPCSSETDPVFVARLSSHGQGSPDSGLEVESSTEPDIALWDVDHVVKFVHSVPGCQEYAETFREHRIDGATLPHLSEDHLLNFVKMKLGPAIKLRLAVARLATN